MKKFINLIVSLFAIPSLSYGQTTTSLNDNEIKERGTLYFGHNNISMSSPIWGLMHKVGYKKNVRPYLQWGTTIGVANSTRFKRGNDCDPLTGCSLETDELYRVAGLLDFKFGYFHVIPEMGYNLHRGSHRKSYNVGGSLNKKFDAQYFDVRISGNLHIPFAKHWDLVLTPLALKVPIYYTKLEYPDGFQDEKNTKDILGNYFGSLQGITNAAVQYQF